jgi:antitoxin ParD1/3/4
MNVSLTPELEKLVRDKVESGRYLSASEVIREGLRLLEKRDRLYELQQRHSIQVGQTEQGELMDEENGLVELEADIQNIE